MSKQLINKLFAEAYDIDVGNPKFRKRLLETARRSVNRSGLHLLELTVEDFEQLILYNYVTIVQSSAVRTERKKIASRTDVPLNKVTQKEGADVILDKESSNELKKEAREIAEKVFARFEKDYNKLVKIDAHKVYQISPTALEVLQPKNDVEKTRIAFVSSFMEAAKGSPRLSKLRGGKARAFQTRTQFHHKERTVGTDMAQTLADQFKKTNIKIPPEARKRAVKVIENIIRGISYNWEKVDTPKGRYARITGTLGPRALNQPGDEPGDWRNLGPEIEQALFENLQDLGGDFATKQGSQPVDERLAETLINEEILDGLLGRKGVKGTKYKVDKGQNKTRQKSNSKKQKRAKGASPTMRAPRLKKTSSRNQEQQFSQIRLLGILNSQLPNVVRNNMGDPALNYQTGRFASSVRVTDIGSTSQGFPSIGYTYDRDPYETFEVGNRQGSIERDPRRLIDKSIREIAVSFALGRFYTRRV